MREGFERFEGARSRSKKTPEITIRGTGAISFNRTAYEILKRPKAVLLFYNHKVQSMGGCSK
jgi:hypothetical protein